MKNNVPVFNSKLAQELVTQGYRIVDLDKNHDVPGEIVFYFAEEDGLLEYIEAFTKLAQLRKKP